MLASDSTNEFSFGDPIVDIKLVLNLRGTGDWGSSEANSSLLGISKHNVDFVVF